MTTARMPLDDHLLQRLPALGFDIDLGRMEDYLALIERAIRARTRLDIFNQNLHSLYLYFRHPDLRAMFASSVVMVDGTSVLWLLRLLGYRVDFSQRMAWIDFIWPLLTAAEREGWRVYYVGNTPEVLADGMAAIIARLPRLILAGRAGYFDDRPGSADNEAIIADINAFGADLCIVGMGSPREQRWIKRHHPRISAPVMLNAGACLEFVSGHVPTPPRWLGPLGCEWAFRLVSSPRRFAFRYLVEPWYVLVMLLAEGWRRRWRKLARSRRSAGAEPDAGGAEFPRTG